ncbi:MAG TPA: hypothetical protein VFS17_10555 [Methylophilaceae bacterium]|nr:hypothetical protein [Methylophilaceae bacterium]
MKSRLAKRLWASPCTFVGLVFAAPLMLLGARAVSRQGTLEVALRRRHVHCHKTLSALPFRGITFGHVILAVTEEELEQLRAHEQVHVRQYERWGIFFFPAYVGSSLWQLLRGRKAYWDNHFEVQARRESR